MNMGWDSNPFVSGFCVGCMVWSGQMPYDQYQGSTQTQSSNHFWNYPNPYSHSSHPVDIARCFQIVCSTSTSPDVTKGGNLTIQVAPIQRFLPKISQAVKCMYPQLFNKRHSHWQWSCWPSSYLASQVSHTIRNHAIKAWIGYHFFIQYIFNKCISWSYVLQYSRTTLFLSCLLFVRFRLIWSNKSCLENAYREILWELCCRIRFVDSLLLVRNCESCVCGEGLLKVGSRFDRTVTTLDTI